MYLVSLFFVLSSFLVPLAGGRYLSRFLVGTFSTFFIFNAFILACFMFFQVALSDCSTVYIDLSSWFFLDFLSTRFNLVFDPLTVSMFFVVLFVSTLVHMYSLEYLKEDPHQIRFFAYISLFTLFMLVLVSSGNLIQLFVGWEGVGIVSYLLVNFWFSRIAANKSSVMAVITNRVGDIALLIAMGFLFASYSSLDFSVIFCNHAAPFSAFLSLELNYVDCICFFLMLAAVGKSAQVGLHMWLPEAMEGPTPVSSLIHAATMVTAGIFLLVRCSFLLENSPISLLWIFFFGSFTAYLGSSIGLFQSDIKKIIAYSTCSQLGYMFFACGFLGFQQSMFHLINHAFLKALLFLSAGVVIHCISHEQDFRRMGGMLYLLPFSYVSLLVGSLSLVGFPFLSGFYSKEGVLQLISEFFPTHSSLNFFNWYFLFSFFPFISVIFTLLYSVKLIFFSFFNQFNGFFNYIKNLHYESFYMLLPLFFLLLFSILSGFLSYDLFVGPGTDFWRDSLYVVPSVFESPTYCFSCSTFSLLNYEFFYYSKELPVYWVTYYLVLSSLFFSVQNIRKKLAEVSMTWFYNFFVIFSRKFIFIDKLVVFPLMDFFFYLAKIIYFYSERGLLEKFGPFGISKLIQTFSNYYLKFSIGFIYHYLGMILLGLFLLLQCLLFL